MQNRIHTTPELAVVEVENMDRSTFLLRGALAAGTLYGAAAVSPFVRKAFSQGSSGDVDILNFALTLEYLEAAFYEQAQTDVKGLSGEVAELAKLIGDHEVEHVDALSATISDLGGKPVKAPKVDFGDAFSSQDAFLALAVTFEDTGVSAYNGAAPMIESKELLATAGAIVQIEGRHAAAVRFAAGESPAPETFDPTLSEDEVLKAVEPFLA